MTSRATNWPKELKTTKAQINNATSLPVCREARSEYASVFTKRCHKSPATSHNLYSPTYKNTNGTTSKYTGVCSGFRSSNQPDNATQAPIACKLYRFSCISPFVTSNTKVRLMPRHIKRTRLMINLVSQAVKSAQKIVYVALAACNGD